MEIWNLIINSNISVNLIIFAVILVAALIAFIFYKIMVKRESLLRNLFLIESEEREKAEEKLYYSELEKKQISETFEKYMDKDLIKGALHGKLREGMRTASFLFTDLRGYSKLSENPRTAKMLLDPYFSIISNVVHYYGGAISQLVGDSVEAMFNIHKEQNEFIMSAVSAGMRIKREVEKFNSIRPKEFPAIRCGIGIDYGDVYLGSVGDDVRRYQPIGEAVTIANSLSKCVSNKVVISKKVYHKIWKRVLVKKIENQNIKGKIIEAYEVQDILQQANNWNS